METFPTLAEYLFTTEPYVTPGFSPRSAWRIGRRAENWPMLYELSKEAWELWGDKGPPIGTKVLMIQPGHGGGAGTARTFEGADERYPNEFVVSRKDHRGETGTSLVNQKIWWTEFVVFDQRMDDRHFRRVVSGDV